MSEAELDRARAAYRARAGEEHPYHWQNPGYVFFMQSVERALLALSPRPECRSRARASSRSAAAPATTCTVCVTTARASATGSICSRSGSWQGASGTRLWSCRSGTRPSCRSATASSTSSPSSRASLRSSTTTFASPRRRRCAAWARAARCSRSTCATRASWTDAGCVGAPSLSTRGSYGGCSASRAPATHGASLRAGPACSVVIRALASALAAVPPLRSHLIGIWRV